MSSPIEADGVAFRETLFVFAGLNNLVLDFSKDILNIDLDVFG